jgi:putative ABC transport system ATP-binding protein
MDSVADAVFDSPSDVPISADSDADPPDLGSPAEAVGSESSASGGPRADTGGEAVAVDVRGITFAWPKGGGPVFEGLDLRLGRGERLFITGPSGCGKSTLLSLVAGIIAPDSGEIEVGGRNLSRLSGPARDRLRGDDIGYVFQQFNLVPYLSAVENVLLPCGFSKARRKRAVASAATPALAAGRLLERLGIPEDLWGRKATRLSVGQQQRVAAARALIGSPPLLIADEPTSALDEETGLTFLRLLLKECALAGSSLMFVSHDTKLAEEFERRFSLSGCSG